MPIAGTPSEKRIAGRMLQARRLRMWSASPFCAGCGKLTEFPHGFELDHKVPLHEGGADTDGNCQILCSGPDGCHRCKTAQDGAYWKRTDIRSAPSVVTPAHAATCQGHTQLKDSRIIKM